jgi:D-3-phosphoglycerate dehydrogenase
MLVGPMRLLIADKLHPNAIEELRTLPVEVEYDPEITRETLEARIPSIGILVVRSTEVTAKTIDAARSLHLIVRAGASFETIDVRAASRRGIYVSNVPGKNASAVVELAYGFMVALDRRIPDAVASLRAGKWERAEFGRAEGLFGKTLGIAGLGAVGREMAARARAFGLTPVAWSRSLTPAKAAELGVGYAASLEELAQRSHILTLHLALNDRTRKCVNERVLAALPKGAMLINTARGDLIDHEALEKAIAARSLKVAVDVIPDEPKGRSSHQSTLFGPRAAGLVYGTPHIAASTDQAQLAIATETVRVIRSFLLEGDVPNVVNVSNMSAARFQMVIRMMDRVGTFANALAVIKRHGINVESVTNTVFEGGGAACAKLRLVARPSEACLAEIRAFEEVLHVEVVPLPNLA